MRFQDIALNIKLLGERIRQARDRLDMPQEELAALVSKDQRAISEYENGKRRLSVVDLPLFAKVLRVPVMYFFEDEIGQEDMDTAMLTEFRRLPTHEDKQAAIDIIRLFSDRITLRD